VAAIWAVVSTESRRSSALVGFRDQGTSGRARGGTGTAARSPFRDMDPDATTGRRQIGTSKNGQGGRPDPTPPTRSRLITTSVFRLADQFGRGRKSRYSRIQGSPVEVRHHASSLPRGRIVLRLRRCPRSAGAVKPVTSGELPTERHRRFCGRPTKRAIGLYWSLASDSEWPTRDVKGGWDDCTARRETIRRIRTH
jgi:hypothetical protein